MAKQKKKGAASSRRRASLKSFAARAKGMFQSPVHSNGFKQDMLIDIYGGDTGFTSGGSITRAGEASAAGKSYYYYDGTLKKVTTNRGSIVGVDAEAADISGKARSLTK